MSDRKHKHKSKEKDKKRDRERDRERERDRKRDHDDNKESDYDRHRKRKRSRERDRDLRSRSRSKDRTRNRSRSVERTRATSRSRDYEHGQSSSSGHKSKYSHYDRDHAPQNENRSSSSPEAEQRHDDDENVTSLVYFSFCDYKSQLSKILMGYQPRDQLVDDAADFWLFIKKYETLLRNSGRPILPQPITDESNIDQKEFDTDRIKFSIPFDKLYGRLSSNDQAKLSELKVRQFLDIVLKYLEFLEKEKLEKIRKLRQMQAELPVAKYKDEIKAAVKSEQVVLVAGDTGCGKSTQIPQYLREAGYENICCTQPRRIACISLSKRVAHEMLCEFTNEVGYQIRFERNKNKDTKIIFMTEGLLLRQLSTEAALTQFDVIVLDEVHERHLHGDFLLGN